eukprot:gene11890-15908_t
MISIFLNALNIFSGGIRSDINPEYMEELRMRSGMKANEIHRLRHVFLKLTNGEEQLSKDTFMNIDSISINPLNDRICVCFGYSDQIDALDFKGFLCGLALFNSPGMKQQKLKVAFRLQDFDDDGVLSRLDLTQYIQRISGGTLNETELKEIVTEVFREMSSDAKQENINFSDFQQVVAPLDFQSKLLLPI